MIYAAARSISRHFTPLRASIFILEFSSLRALGTVPSGISKEASLVNPVEECLTGSRPGKLVDNSDILQYKNGPSEGLMCVIVFEHEQSSATGLTNHVYDLAMACQMHSDSIRASLSMSKSCDNESQYTEVDSYLLHILI